jgi:preprotein translocase subunit SecG
MFADQLTWHTRYMRLKYETGTATLIQFTTLALLGIPDAIVSIISSCSKPHTACVTNSFFSVVFFILVTGWFCTVWILGSITQQRRSRRLAWLLVALFNSRHDSNVLTRGTSVLDVLLAAWVIFLAVRLARAKGGRIVSSARSRRRKPPLTPQL